MEDKKLKFNTLDIYLAGYLALKGVPPILEVKSGKVLFSYDDTKEIQKIISEYLLNAELQNFTSAVKTLRGKMLTARTGEDGRYR